VIRQNGSGNHRYTVTITTITHDDNRHGEDFECLDCGYQNHADYNAVAGLRPAGSKVA